MQKPCLPGDSEQRLSDAREHLPRRADPPKRRKAVRFLPPEKLPTALHGGTETAEKPVDPAGAAENLRATLSCGRIPEAARGFPFRM